MDKTEAFRDTRGAGPIATDRPEHPDRVAPVLPRAEDLDPAFVEFLRARLDEEAQAARGREGSAQGLNLLHELIWEIDHGGAPDRMSVDLLVVAYARHPDFREAWIRWRR